MRNGVFYRDLKPEQVEAALKVARVALGEEGFSRYQEVRAADDAFAKGGGGRGPGGPGGPFRKKAGGDPAQKKAFGPAQKKGRGPGGGAMFGSANYMIAFLGKPSKANPWILQLGGHHLAINIYYKGTAGTATPYHVAAQPTVWKDDRGKTHDPLAPMRDSLGGLLASLTPEQTRRAKLEARFNDVYVGPGKDGKFPAKSEGVPVSELSDASKDFVKVVSAFTLGHSITLVCGALGWASLPGPLVESAIAFSILVSAVHAMIPIFRGREVYIAGGFGLVHGLAFAATLNGFGFDPLTLVSSVLGFNLGVEAFQLLVILAAMPGLVLLARSRVHGPFRVVGAALTGIAATAWLAERAFGWANPIVPLVESVASHALWLLVALVLLTGAVSVAESEMYQRRQSPGLRRAVDPDPAP